MVWEVSDTCASNDSPGISQSAEDSFHCTLYQAIAEPPLLTGVSQDAASFPLPPGETARSVGASGGFADTVSVAALVRVSRLPRSSVKDTRTLTALPASESARV